MCRQFTGRIVYVLLSSTLSKELPSFAYFLLYSSYIVSYLTFYYDKKLLKKWGKEPRIPDLCLHAATELGCLEKIEKKNI